MSGPGLSSAVRRRLLPVATVVSLALLLGGCVYLRLLELRGQLLDFDRYFTVERPAGGLALSCRQPVVRGDDVSWMVTGPPTTQNDGPPPRWAWRFRKEAVAGDAPDPVGRELELAVELQDGLVSRVLFPDAVLKVVPAEVIVAMLRAMGTAEIDRENRIAKATLAAPAQPLAIPGRARIQEWFGKPHAKQAGEATIREKRTMLRDGKEQVLVEERKLPAERLTWRYRLVATDGVAGEAQPLATVAFDFLVGAERPFMFRAQLGENWVSIALPR